MFHKHHIIPKHEWKKRFDNLHGVNSFDNIAYLTTEQHIECHKWLWEQYGSKQDKLAYEGLSGCLGKDEIIRQISSFTHKGKIVHHVREDQRIAVSNALSKKYKLISPEGETFVVDNLRRFCEENGLIRSYHNFASAASGWMKKHGKEPLVCGWGCAKV